MILLPLSQILHILPKSLPQHFVCIPSAIPSITTRRQTRVVKVVLSELADSFQIQAPRSNDTYPLQTLGRYSCPKSVQLQASISSSFQTCKKAFHPVFKPARKHFIQFSNLSSFGLSIPKIPRHGLFRAELVGVNGPYISGMCQHLLSAVPLPLCSSYPVLPLPADRSS